MDEYIKLLTDTDKKHIHTIKISYNSVRPKGERLKTFGGTASGHQPLKEMFEGIDDVLKNRIDPSLDPIEADDEGFGHVRPVHILDIGNLICFPRYCPFRSSTDKRECFLMSEALEV